MRHSLSCLYFACHTTNQVVYPYHVALGPMPLGELAWVATFRVATLRPSAMHIHQFHSSTRIAHEPQRLAEGDVCCAVSRVPSIQM